jgi:hypothetical protein
MSKPKGLLISVVVLLSLVGLELVLSSLKPPDAAVRITNMGETPIVDMRITFGDGVVVVGTIAPQDSAVVHFSGRKKDALKVSFSQLDNPLSGFEVADFDPSALRRQGRELALEIRMNEYSRAQVTDETPTTLSRLTQNLWSWFGADVEPSP